MNCHECGAPLKKRMGVRRTIVGRYTVEDGPRAVLACEHGHDEIDLDTLAEYEQRAALAVVEGARELGGAEIRFARKALGLSQTAFGERLDVTQETVSRWESDKLPLSRTCRAVLFALLSDPDGFARMASATGMPGETLTVRAA